jgi:hypothetical protein
MTIEILTLEQADRWRALLAETPIGDVYHHPGYAAALAARGEGTPLFFHYRTGKCVAHHAVLLRPLRALPFAHPYGDRFDAVSPYGYAGPVLSDPACAGEVWRAWTAAAQARGVVAEFVRFHPLLANHELLRPLLDVRRAGETVWIDLTHDFEPEFSASCRRNVRFAARRGLTVERADHRRLPHFWAMYSANMRRKEADDYYFFDEAYFRRLTEAFGDDCRLMRCGRGERDAAYTLCLRHGETLHYHLSCSDDAMAKVKPVDLLIAETAKLGRASGLRRFHLGGGYHGADSLLEFKARFSPLRAAFFVGRAIHDADAVERLTELARAAGAAPDDPHFFPPYRTRR